MEENTKKSGMTGFKPILLVFVILIAVLVVIKLVLSAFI